MDRKIILDTVINNIKLNVDGIEDVEISADKSMKDYGASSLDIVEIVSSSMRQLKIKVPRTQLAELKNIDELVDVFFQAKNQAA
ncbi:acyl carrier protein [Nostoc sp. CENA67]|uniref:Acyl carrier protein n=1 Tax=Amazonocrinis nigriterrae CENA67 TaxID=2794033 RepID=A0A8J7HKR3_9NOST|nr:phosphopantetheine-binding protein [Amazonocrinis nigriterrae]MBH8561403.1 acyl carrier protein [Amazonocrinis nigriterrae CENA67]